MLYASVLRRVATVAVCAVVIFDCGCSEETTTTPTPTSGGNSMIIVNQGEFGKDNGNLTRFDFATGKTDTLWFSSVNASLKLGASVNSIALKGDTAFIAATESRSVEVINAKTGVSLGRMVSTDQTLKPWNIVVVSPTVGVYSTQNGDGIQFFNPSTLSLLQHIKTGPSTEGIAVTNGRVFVANSGYGDIRAKEAGAGTISVINVTSGAAVDTLECGPNVREIITNATGTRVYAFYQHLYSQADSLQGIVEYDATTLKELRRWRTRSSGSLTFVGSDLYFFDYNPTTFVASKVMKIALDGAATVAEAFALPTAISSPQKMYYHTNENTLWISDAKNYTSNGAVYTVSLSGAILRTVGAGLVPYTMVYVK